jgi:hypothetical protein
MARQASSRWWYGEASIVALVVWRGKHRRVGGMARQASSRWWYGEARIVALVVWRGKHRRTWRGSCVGDQGIIGECPQVHSLNVNFSSAGEAGIVALSHARG